MKRCLHPLLSRTGARVAGALFIGNQLHAILPMERMADGYEAIIPPDLQLHLDSAAVQSQGIALSDLDVPRARPLLYSRETGWSYRAERHSAQEAVAHDLAIAALGTADLWPVDSLATLIVTLRAMGYGSYGLAHALYLSLLGRYAGSDDLTRLARQLRLRPGRVSEMVFDFMASPEFRNQRHSLTEPPGVMLRMLLSTVRHSGKSAFGYNINKFSQSSQADFSREVALTGGWWNQGGEDGPEDYWSSYSAAIVIRPQAAGRWRFRADKSDRDAGIPVDRGRTTGEPGLEARLEEDATAVTLDFTSPTGAALLLEQETDRFLIPSTMDRSSNDHRSLAMCFRHFRVEAA